MGFSLSSLFGSKSSSSATSSTETTDVSTQNTDLSGVVANAPVVSGEGITLNSTTNFDKDISDAFQGLVDLTGEGLRAVEDTSSSALAALISNRQQELTPNASVAGDYITKAIPLVAIAVGGYALIKIFGGK